MPNGLIIDPGDFEVDMPETDSFVIGVNAVAHAAENIAGVRGFNRKRGPGVMGSSKEGEGVLGLGGTNGVHGQSAAAEHSGVWGENTRLGFGVAGTSQAGEGVLGIGGTNGVHGQSNASEHSGVWGENSGSGFGVAGTSADGVGVFGQGGRLAGEFHGDVKVLGDVDVTGDLRLVNGDCAEYFDVSEAEQVEPGTVMVLDETGALQQSRQGYDKRVAGVISGAGGYRPGIVLDTWNPHINRLPIALLGKVYCKVDAQYSPIEVGDLLTTSPTPGHAMKADDPLKAFGTVIGKAMRSLQTGRGLIPILIALQ